MTRTPAEALPQDVVCLVVAARELLDTGEHDRTDEGRALFSAVEAFSERVPYEDEPGPRTPILTRGECEKCALDHQPLTDGQCPPCALRKPISGKDVARIRQETIEQCARVAEAFDDPSRDWLRRSVWDEIKRDTAARIRSLSATATSQGSAAS